MPFDFTTAWVHRLTNEMQQWEDTLVREEAQDLLGRVGISAKLRAIQSHDGSVRGLQMYVPEIGILLTELCFLLCRCRCRQSLAWTPLHSQCA